MTLLATFVSNFGELPGQFVSIFSNAQTQRQFPFISDMCPFHAEADTEGAETLVTVSFELWLVEDFLQNLSGNFIALPCLGFQIAAALCFPALLLSGLQFPSVFRVADELGGMQFFHCSLHLS